MNDKQLRLSVIDELDFEPSIDATHIHVAVEDGVVTLTGHARNYAEKSVAEKAACRVKGVRAVAEQIEVRYRDDETIADAEIERRALSILAWDATVPEAVKVKVRKGWVRLAGAVDWHYQRQAAESAVSRLSGVVGISNLIGIRSRTHAYDIQKAIEEALKRSAELETCSIRVVVGSDDKVTLEGKVHAWFERSLAERAAWSAPGVQAVDDQLLVG